MAIMFDHAVKYHGKYYPANTPIEEPDKKAAWEAQEPAPEAEEANDVESVVEEAEPAKKAAKTRKKGDA